MIQNFDLIVRGFQIVLGRFLNFDRDITIVFQVLGQPDCGKVAPAELLNDDIPIHQDLSHMNRMIAANLIVRHALIFTTILIIEERIVNLLLERSEVETVLSRIARLGRIRLR